MKTCGTTTPLDCIEELTRLVREFSGFDTVEVRVATQAPKSTEDCAGDFLLKEKLPETRTSEASSQTL